MMPRRSSRRICVKGVQYRWGFSCPIDRAQRVVRANVTVELESASPKSRLIGQDQFWWGDPGPDVCMRPKIVEALIEYALSNGWQPESSDDFHIHYLAPYLGLPGDDYRWLAGRRAVDS